MGLAPPVLDMPPANFKNTAMKPRFVHIGFPKCASTTLQTQFFGNHPDIYFLGIGNNNGKPFPERYIDNDVAIAFEMNLRYKKELLYDYDAMQAVFQKHFEAAEQNESIKVVGASYEHLAFTFTNDVDATLKAKRLHHLFGNNTKILLFVRNQFDFLKSMYSEFLKCGFTLTFDEYIDYNYLMQDRLFMSDIIYNNIYQLYADLFGKENVFVLPFEEFRAGPLEAMKKVEAFNGISHMDIPLDKVNMSVKPIAREMIRQFNLENRNNLGNSLYEGSEFHRLYLYYKEELKAELPEKVYNDHKARRQITELNKWAGTGNEPKTSGVRNVIRKFSKKANKIEDTPLVFNEKYKQLLHQLFAPGNKALAEATGLNLEQYDYPL
jgi:hypothetical protein